jgi:hypothetical protein
MSKEKLLLCPFCGGEVYLDREYIFCDDCHLIMRIDDRLYNGEAITYDEAKEQTIKAWNTRKPLDRIVEQLEEMFDRSGLDEGKKQIMRDIIKKEGL